MIVFLRSVRGWYEVEPIHVLFVFDVFSFSLKAGLCLLTNTRFYSFLLAVFLISLHYRI